MDQVVEPDADEFVLTVDGVDKTPDTFAWTNALESTIVYSEAVLGPSVVRLRYSTSTERLRSLLGEIVTPFDILVDAP